MQYPRILSKPVFLLLTPALIVQVCSLYLIDDNDDNEQKFDKINTGVVSSYSAETYSTETSTDSTGWDETDVRLLFQGFAIIVNYHTWCWQKKYISVLIWFVMLCVVEKKIIQFVMEHLCHSMIDWLWIFNAISAILQSYESKMFNIFTIDDAQKISLVLLRTALQHNYHACRPT